MSGKPGKGNLPGVRRLSIWQVPPLKQVVWEQTLILFSHLTPLNPAGHLHSNEFNSSKIGN